MGFEDGQIIFNHDNLVYYPGQVVYGKLAFNQEKNKIFRAMAIMKGYCKVHWTTTHYGKVDDRYENYTIDNTSNETYFEEKVYLTGGQEGEMHLQPGHHEFPFQFTIPPNCPSSFEDENGHIRYECKVICDRPFEPDQEICKTITVVNQKDLNSEPLCKTPMVFELLEPYCCWFMSMGSCEVTATLPQSGYCPGQTINIDLKCVNRSNVEIDSIKFELFEHRTFTATQNSETRGEKTSIVVAMKPETREEKTSLVVVKKGPIPKETNRNWTVVMVIPPMDLYNLDKCNFIDIDHNFEVTLSPSGCHSEHQASRDIILGHIPLKESEPPQENAHPLASPMPQPPYPTDQQYSSQPYPPYPSGNQSFPTQSPVTRQPFPSANLYPAGPMPFPSPSLGMKSPYPSADPPQPGFSIPATGDKDSPSLPLLPPNVRIPYPTNSPGSSPFATASAPEPSTPDQDVDDKPDTQD